MTKNLNSNWRRWSWVKPYTKWIWFDCVKTYTHSLHREGLNNRVRFAHRKGKGIKRRQEIPVIRFIFKFIYLCLYTLYESLNLSRSIKWTNIWFTSTAYDSNTFLCREKRSSSRMFILFRHPHFNRTKVLYFSSNNKRLREEKKERKKEKKRLLLYFVIFFVPVFVLSTRRSLRLGARLHENLILIGSCHVRPGLTYSSLSNWILFFLSLICEKNKYCPWVLLQSGCLSILQIGKRV